MCPEGFTDCAGQCYSLQPGTDYESAERRCAQLNSTLAIPRTLAENLCVAGLANGKRTWLGVTDREKEGVFLAADGTPIAELHGFRWAPSQPDNYLDAEHCVEINGMNAVIFNVWNDMPCANTTPLPMCQLV